MTQQTVQYITVVFSNLSWLAYLTAFRKCATASSSLNLTSDNRSRCVMRRLSNIGGSSTKLSSIFNISCINFEFEINDQSTKKYV